MKDRPAFFIHNKFIHMKRYLTGIAAVIIAIGAVAFTQPAKNLNLVTFQYNPPNGTDYGQTSVETNSNWSVGSPSCSGDDNKACTLQVLSTETTSMGTELGSGVIITASLGGVSGDYYVSCGTNISNVQNKN